MTAPVAIVMGSQSDWPTMKCAADALDKLGVAYEARIVSAHRTPDRMYDFARSARDEGFKVIIACAGGAAHLPGMVAALTPLPVLASGETVIVSAHGNSLRALVKHLSGISDADITGLEIPTGEPIVYEFDETMRAGERHYLKDR